MIQRVISSQVSKEEILFLQYTHRSSDTEKNAGGHEKIDRNGSGIQHGTANNQLKTTIFNIRPAPDTGSG